MDLTGSHKSISSRQQGFTFIEVALVLFVLISLLVIFYANSNKSSDLRLARAAIFEAKKIAYLAEECRNKISSRDDSTGVFVDSYAINSSQTYNVSGMLSTCGYNIDIPDQTPFDYSTDYDITITTTDVEVEFYVPIANYKNDEIHSSQIVPSPSGNGVDITIYGSLRANPTSKFSNRALLEKNTFFGEKINRDG
ncbi:MAG: hypothetical protein D6B28_11665 [Gammaproteobacteria bacterium]|nr:MAG: hypothetical protein D6B28_11665 [Gammaproteobacteria bacterium]